MTHRIRPWALAAAWSLRRSIEAPTLHVRERLEWAASWYRCVRTTFEVVRLLDREGRLVAAVQAGPPGFVAQTGGT